MSNKRKMNVTTLSDEEIQDLFEESFRTQVADRTSIGEFECKCIREIGSKDITMEVTIAGFAGTPTLDQFKNDEIEEAKEVSVSRDDKGEITFKLQPEKTVSLNTNDFIVSYTA